MFPLYPLYLSTLKFHVGGWGNTKRIFFLLFAFLHFAFLALAASHGDQIAFKAPTMKISDTYDQNVFILGHCRARATYQKYSVHYRVCIFLESEETQEF